MRKTEIAKYLISLWLILASFQAISQHSHPPGDNESQLRPAPLQAPHGGVMRAAGKYMVEMVVNPFEKTGKVTFYFTKSNLKAVSIEAITAFAVFEFDDGTITSEELAMIGESEFTAQSDRLESFHCTATFSVKKKRVSASFDYEGHIFK